MLTIPERIAQVAEHIARHDVHGYSQNNRAGDGTTESVTLSDGSKVVIHGGDYDCSEMVRVCVNCALSGSYKNPIDFMWTGSQDEELTALGFKRLTFNGHPVRGDILWRKGHTGIALGNGRQAEAYIDESGTTIGHQGGDQTGNEVRTASLASDWTTIYRYPTAATASTGVIPMSFKFRFNDYTNVRDKPSVKSGKKISWLDAGDVWTFDGVVISEGRVWGTYIGPRTKKRLYAALAVCDMGQVVK